MLGLDKEVGRLGLQPSVEGVQALKRIIPCATIRSILKKHRQQHRHCPRLPKAFMVLFIVALGLFCADCYRQVFRWLQPFRPKGTPGRSTLCEARQRLGVAPLRSLFLTVVRLLAAATTPAAWYGPWRLMAVDGFVVDVPDTPTNARVFGRPRGGRGGGAFPQARVLALCELGTHVIWRCLLKPLCRAEISMAPVLLRELTPEMLLLWDRGFLSYVNVQLVQQRQAQLLARIRSRLIFHKDRVLSDGSYLAQVYSSRTDRRHGRNGIQVRIIEYAIRDGSRADGQTQRLLTTLLDARRHPAKRLVELYHERWEEELAFDELKTHLRERPVLRSETPAGVVQELYGLLLAHFVVRRLMAEAAATKSVAPRRLSFTGTLKILRCRLPQCPDTAHRVARWYTELLAEIAEEELPPRRNRINPRVIKRKMSKWAKKRPEHRRRPQPTKRFRDTIEIRC